MVDYTEKLRQDLVEQFKEKPVIDALMGAIGEQLTDLHRFSPPCAMSEAS